MTGLYPKRGKYKWVSFCEKCDRGIVDWSKYNYPLCFCALQNKMCFIAWKKCPQNTEIKTEFKFGDRKK